MSVDPSIELFTVRLFNRLWLDYCLIDEPLAPPVIPGEPVEDGPMNEDIVQAVKVRQVLFRLPYQVIFDETYCEFQESVSDFYDYLERNFPHKNYLQVMEKVLATCAFVAEMTQYSHSKNNNIFIHHTVMVCALYIDAKFKQEFYKQGGWTSLFRTCQNYILPYAFIKQHSKTITSPYGSNTISFCVSDCMVSLRSFERFTQSFSSPENPLTDPSFTMLWVDYCIKDLEIISSKPMDFITFTKPSIKDSDFTLGKLRIHCDPAGSKVKMFDDVIKLAKVNGRCPIRYINAYLNTQGRNKMLDPFPDFHALECFLGLDQPAASPENGNQSSNDQDNAKIRSQIAVLLDNNQNGVIRTVGMESQEKMSIKCSEFKLNSCPPDTSRISMSSGTQTTCVSSSVSAKTESVENESLLPIVQISDKVFTPKGINELSDTPKDFEKKEDSDLIIDLLSEIDINSTNGVNTSPNPSRSSGVMKKRRSGGKENSPTIQVSKSRKSGGKENSPVIQASISRKSGGKESSPVIQASKSRKSGGKENSPDIQASEYTCSSNESSDILNVLKGEKDKDQATYLHSRLDVNPLAIDGVKTISKTISPPRILGESPSTTKVSDGKIANDQGSRIMPSDSPQSDINAIVLDKPKVTDKIDNEDSIQNQYPSTTNKVLVKESSDEKKVPVEDSLKSTASEVSSGNSSRTSNTDSAMKKATVKDALKIAATDVSSENLSGPQLPSTSKKSFKKKKKSKTSEESTFRITRRQQLLKTEETAEDILRMIHVLGNQTSLNNIKSTLKNYGH